MKIIAWNIWHGGGTRIAAIAATLLERDADVLVLGEYQTNRTARLLTILADAGYPHASFTAPPGRFGGVVVVSKHALETRELPPDLAPYGFRYHVVHVPSHDVAIHGVYAPLPTDPYREYWTAKLRYLTEISHTPVLVTGDFNAGAKGFDSTAKTVFCTEYFNQLPDAGYQDLWRHEHGPDAREYTWNGRAFPYRLDHAFGSPEVARRLRACTYDHSVREQRLSDHSMLTIELAPTSS